MESTDRKVSWLTLARLYRGYSQSELAREAGFEPSQISRLEAGNRQPRMLTAQRLADALDVPVDRLFPYKEPSAMEIIAEHFGLEKDRAKHAKSRRAKQAKR
jgi:transcriptional regulator with XRE-family HTH domain